MDKKALRLAIGHRKREMTAQEITSASARLAEKLFATEAYRSAKSLYAYLAFNQEVRTCPIIRRAWADVKRVAVPKIIGGEMTFIWIDSFDGLRPGYRDIPEPVDDGPAAHDETALVLLPGLAFDPDGRRVGYGGGYYDRYLAAHPGHPKLALCYGFQMFDRLETEPHDVCADIVIADI